MNFWGEEGRGILNQEGVTYCTVFWLFALDGKIGKVRYLGGNGIPLGSGGEIISGSGGVPFIGNMGVEFLGNNAGKEMDMKILVAFSETFLFPCLLGLSFMHCRNVKVVEEIPPPKLSKKHEKKHGVPLFRYHVLKIDHMKTVLEKEGHASSEGLKKALHICRGHFATYGKDGKGLLFGRHAGRYWIPMHTRGNPELGVVEKDYDVK